MNTAPRTGYAPVNGLELYYEVHGTGEPLILLHGGAFGIQLFGPNVEEFAKTRRVIAVELQGHGRTADIDRPLSYEAMADDVAAFMQYLGVARADVLGYSLGGDVAQQLAFRHAGLVRRLIVVATACKRDGWFPEVRAEFDQMGAAVGEQVKSSPLAQRFPNVDWAALFTKIGVLLRQDYDWSAEVAKIAAPTMLVFADADAVRPEHIVEFFGLLGGGQRDAGWDGSGRPVARLAILPGRTHYDIGAAPELVAAVTPFLDAPLPGAK